MYIHKYTSIQRVLACVVTVACLFSVASLPALAQASNNGAITGRVLNQATGKYLANAVVTVEGTGLQALTDDIGAYRILNLTPGNYTVSASYTELDRGTSTVTVAAGETATADFSLTSQVYYLEKFVVASEREGAAKALQDQRYSSSMINVVAADSFGNMVDGNIGELMKKLPGVAIDYDGEDPGKMRFRGMDPNMASITLDGNPIASRDVSSSGGGSGTFPTANRSFNLSNFAVQNIETIEVNFAPTPDQSANSMGGSVNFKTKNAFAQKGRRIRLDGNLSLNTEALEFGKTPGGNRTPDRKIKPGLMFQYTEAFGTVRPVGVSVVANFFQKYRQSNNYDVTSSFSANALQDNGGIATPDMQGTISRLDWVERGTATERRNLNINLDWKLSDNTSVFLRTGYTQDLGIGQYQHRFRINVGTHLGETADHPESNFDNIVGRNSNVEMTSQITNENTKLWNINIGAQQKFGRLEIDYDAYVSQSKSARNPNENFIIGYNRDAINLSVYDIVGNSGNIQQTDTNGVPLPREEWSYLDLANYHNLSITQDIANGSSDQMGAKFNVTLPVTISNASDTWSFPLKLKFGASINEENVNTTKYYRNLKLTGDSNVSAYGTSAEPTLQQFADPYYQNAWRGFDNVPIPQWISPYAVYDHYLTHPEQFYTNMIDISSKASQLQYSTYGREKKGLRESNERVLAGYIMGTANIDKLTVLAGVRYEATWLTGWRNVMYNDQDGPFNSGHKFDAVNATIDGQPNPRYGWSDPTSPNYNPYGLADLLFTWAKSTYNYDKIFPNLQLKYDITHNLIARASYTTNMGRPNLSDVLFAEDRVNLGSNAIDRPNPDLQPQTSKLYQIRLEYYFSKFGVATLSAFYQPFKNYIITDMFYEPYSYYSDADESGEMITEMWQINMKRNIGKGRNYGVELSYQQRLGFFADWLNRVELYLALSFCDPKGTYRKAPAIPSGWSTPLDEEHAELYNQLPREQVDIELPGIKKFYGTASLSYKGSRFSAALTAMWTDEFSYSINTSTLAPLKYASNTRMDFSANYRLSRHWQAYFDWRNFTNVPDERSTFGRTRGYYESGMVVNVGVRADF